ncbi:MAG: acyltransferase, partial [Cyanobacteria bacterium J06632_19]
ILIDENVYIGPYVIITGTGNVKIGKNCLIAPHCGIFANNHVFADPTQTIEAQGTTGEGIVIENDCWLGHNVTVLDGVRIGEGSIIGAGSVVNKSIPAFSIAVGTPARVIKNRLDKQTANLSSPLRNPQP